jgi:MscS family membrane protein
MNSFLRRFSAAAVFLVPALALAQEAGGEAAKPPATDFLEHIVDWVLQRFGVTLGDSNTTTHFVVSAVFLVAAFLLRRAVTNVIFHFLKKAAAKTETTLDDKLFPALESPVASFITVTGIFAALKVLKLSESADTYIGYGSTVAFSLVIFWGLLRAFGAILDHAQEIAVEKQMGVAAFMPWIRKTLIAVFVIIGGLLTIQSLGYNVTALLQGLGIGGLAFALAAQDTIANLFGSIVVAIDQPFKVGETIRIGANQGTVEEIGLRSTKIRLVDKSLVAIPNRAVSSEPIVNLSRFTGRRSEQVFGLTYDTTPEQLEAMVAEVRRIITAEPDVDPASVLVFFRDLSASSLDIWSVYVTRSPDNPVHLATRQRINLAIMRAVAARGLSFAFPTQTVIHDGPVAKKLAEK